MRKHLTPFLDEITIKVKAGGGGPGMVSFAGSRRKVQGGPDGGDGGRGGAVVFQASKEAASLRHLKKKQLYQAEAGRPGQSKKRKGQKGQDLILLTPPDTWIDIGSKRILLKKQNHFIIAQGGRGGRGNWFFKTSQNPSPRKAELGKKGQSLSVRLKVQLKIRAVFLGLKPVGPDVFLDTPKGSYLFTEKQPKFIFLDTDLEGLELPALEQCSKAFLKSVEFCGLLVFVMILKSKDDLLKEKRKIDHLMKENCPLFFKKKHLIYLFDPCAGFSKQKSLKAVSKKMIQEAKKMFHQENLETIWTVNQLRSSVKKYAG